MKLIISTILLIVTISTYLGESLAQNNLELMAGEPQSFINIEDYAVYGSWGAVAIIHHVLIENKSDLTYKDIKIRICYTSISSPGYIVSQETGVLPVILPPRSKNMYLEGGVTLGSGSQAMNAVSIQVLDAKVVR